MSFHSIMQEDQPVASTSAVQILPYITVQHDLQNVIKDVADGTVSTEPFWVSVYQEGQETVHGKVIVRPHSERAGEVELEGVDGIVFERGTHSSSFFISTANLPKTSVKLPKSVQGGLIDNGIDAMDISPDGELYVVGGTDGKLRVGSAKGTSTASSPLYLKGHVGDVMSCYFFPSSQVVLSTSSDLSIRIWSATDGSNPRTLTGHSAAVTDAAIIERGKNILSASNDGTVKLWQVGSGKCLKTYRPAGISRKRVTRLALAKKDKLHSRAEPDVSTRPAQGDIEPEVAEYIAFGGLENGKVAVMDLEASGSDPPVHTLQVSTTAKAISALAWDEASSTLACGTVDGFIALYSLSSLQDAPTHLASIKRNQADITSLAFSSQTLTSDAIPSLLAATSDGLPFELTLGKDGIARVAAELAGYDIDAANAVVCRNAGVFLAGKDGSLRRY